MRHGRIYLDPKLENMGFSGGTFYEDEHLYISTGTTNSWSREEGRHPNWKVINITFRGAFIELTAGEDIRKMFEDTKKEDVAELAFSILLKNITGETFLQLIENTRLKGLRSGREELQKEMRKSLGLE